MKVSDDGYTKINEKTDGKNKKLIQIKRRPAKVSKLAVL